MLDTLPKTFGRYRILKKLGQGGMGAVYLAEDTRMRRKVALKVPDFHGKESSVVLDRFYREAHVASEIRHPGVCPVHDVDCIDGVHFLTMAYIDGSPLIDVLRSGQPWQPVKAIVLVLQLADALQALHAHDIVHRDLKPGNIMLQPDGSPVLLDFGLARSLVVVSHQLTGEGAAMGTPAYMAPEQIGGKAANIGPHTDVYALGVILFQLLTGRLPFQPGSLAELYGLLLHAERPRPSEFVAVGAALDQLCLDALAIDPTKRPATMPDLIARLQQCRDYTPTSTRDGVTTQCPTCGKRVRITEKMANKRVRCPGCRSQITSPGTPPPAAVPVPEPHATTQLVSLINTLSTVHRPGSDVMRQPSRTDLPAANTRTIALIAGVAVAAVAVVATTVGLLLSGSGSATTQTSNQVVQTPPTNLAPGASVRLLPIADMTLTAGQAQPVTVRIERLNNDKREVKLYQEGGAKGIRLELSPIAAGTTQVQLNVANDGSAPEGRHTIRLVASVDDKIQSKIEWTVHIKPAVVALEPPITNTIGMKFKLIPRGTFQMGSSKEDREKVEQHYKDIGLKPEEYKEYLDREQPQHEVEITKPFYMGVYEVTQEEWEAVMGKDKNESYFRKGGKSEDKVKDLDTKRFPVENVSYKDVETFCEKLNKLAKEKGENCLYRLPTEAEWEYSRRGGSTSLFHYGDKLTYREANFDWDYPFNSTDKKTYLGRPVPVDDPNYKPNGFGLYHMHGNVWEWCSDWYGEYPSGKLTDPEGPKEGSVRVCRGGCWSTSARDCRAANRVWSTPDFRNNGLGFRLARVPSGKDK